MSVVRFGLLSFVLVMISVIPLHADLGDFVESAEEEAAENDEKETKKDVPDDDSDDDEGFWDLLFAITGILWYVHNSSTWYLAYPYEDTMDHVHYIAHDSLYTVLEPESPGRKRSTIHLSLSGGPFWESNDIGGMTSFRITGKFGSLVGPDVGYRIFADPSGELHYLQTGLNLPFVQTDLFSLDMNFGAGFYFGLLRLDAFAFGAEIRSYPVRPLSITLRAEGLFGSYIRWGEFGLRVGYHIRRFELSAGYYGLYASGSTIQGVELGGTVSF